MKPFGQNNPRRSPIVHDFNLYGLSPDQKARKIQELCRAISKQDDQRKQPRQSMSPTVILLRESVSPKSSPKSQNTATNLGKENFPERRAVAKKSDEVQLPDFDGWTRTVEWLDSGVGAGSSCWSDASEIKDRKTTARPIYSRKAKSVVFKRVVRPRKRNAIKKSVLKTQRKIPPATQTVDHPQNVQELEDGQQINGKRKFASEAEIASVRAKRRKWLETRETDSQWVKCCHENCGKWRLVFQYEDAAEVPEYWYCDMNLDEDFSSCDAPEEKIPKTVRLELIETEYSIGSLVWARLDGFPWWPAIVDECPELFQFCILEGTSVIPTKYNVVFIDSKKPNRAWIRKRDLKAYKKNPRALVVKKTKFRNKDWKTELDEACALADGVASLTVNQRIKKIGWVARNSKERVKKTPQATRKSQRLREKYTLEDNGLTREEEIEREKLETRFKVGDIVWAQAYNYPWWPAIIDTCPKLGKHIFVSKTRRELSKYFVVYFNDGKVEYDYLSEENVEEFDRIKVNQKTKYRNKQEKQQAQQAYRLAMEAKRMSLETRLLRFGIKQRLEEQFSAHGNDPEWTVPKGSPPWYDDEQKTDELRDQPNSVPNYSRSPLSKGENSASFSPRTKKSAASTSCARSPIISPFFSPQPGCSGTSRFSDLKTLRKDSTLSSVSNDSKYCLRSKTSSECSWISDDDPTKEGTALIEEVWSTWNEGL